MVGTVTWRPVPVPIGVRTREESVDRILEIALRTGAGLDERQSGRGMRGEDVAEAVALAGTERSNELGQVDHPAPARRDVKLVVHHVAEPRRGGHAAIEGALEANQAGRAPKAGADSAGKVSQAGTAGADSAGVQA